MNKLDLEQIKKEISKDNYKVISTYYINAHSPLELECPNGHKLSLSWQKWSQGRRCKYCSGSRLYFEEIKMAFESEGYELLTKEKDYKNTKQKLIFICPAGHKHFISYSHWCAGNRCKFCFIDDMKKSFEFVKNEIEKEGYIILSDSKYYKDSKSKILCRCPEEHEIYISWNSWQAGIRCKECSLKKRNDGFRLDYELIKKTFESENYKLISKKYINAFEKLDYVCPNGHEGSIRWNDFQQGYRCGKCSHNISKPEEEISEFLLSLGLNVENNIRNIITPLELDIVLPDKMVAIEYCGLYWHSEVMGKNSDYHLNKLNRCKELGYRLITIFEDEWKFKKDIVLNRIKHILNVSDSKPIYARKCNLVKITAQQKNNFLEENHLQGKDSSVVKLGLVYDNELVSVMTFSHGNISKGSKSNKYIWELNRFCNKSGFSVVGAASKLLKYFTLNYVWQEIFSYADRRWSDGNLYNKLGFSFAGPTKIGYWYTNGVKRIHRFNLRKKKDDPKELTEYEIRNKEGLYRIWDCGNLKYYMINGGI